MRALHLLMLMIAAIGGCSGNAVIAARPSIVLVPIGDVAADVLADLERALPAAIDGHVRLAAPIPLPPSAYTASRDQYLGDALLRELERRDFGSADRLVGIVDADLYAPRLNFIFGQARLPGRVAVVALPRLRRKGNLRERLLKVTVHELGHSFGYRHCENETCVMRFANTLGQLDEQGARYCRRERPRSRAGAQREVQHEREQDRGDDAEEATGALYADGHARTLCSTRAAFRL